MIRTLRYRKVRAGPGEELDQHKENSSTHPTIETYKIGPIMAKKVLHRTAALTAAFGIAIAAGGYGALEPTPVFAQETTDPAPTAAPITQEIPDDATGTLTITKFLNNTAGDQATGEKMDTAGMGTALAGVEYTVQRVVADVTTNEGLTKAAALTPGTAVSDGSPAHTATTGPGGVATFEGLPVGVYLVTETEIPAEPAGVVPSAPFLVFMPMTNPDGTGWNYDVHAYPKNSQSEVKKTVEDADKNVGDDITYTITSDIPALSGNTKISKYQVTDNLDESMLTTTAGEITVTLEGTGLTVTLAPEDYTITVNEATQEVLVNFETSGREKLTQAKKDDPNAKVVTSITAAVGAIGDGTGIVTNDAQTITNNGAGSGDTTTNSDSVKSMWGKVNINKTGPNAEGKEVALPGAVFSVYRCNENGALDEETGPLTIGEAANDTDPDTPGTQYTTDAAGAITVDGLHVTNYEDGAELTPAKNYCLVEEKAPAGYAKLREPIRFQLHEGATDVTGDATAGKIVYAADVTNYKDNRLPGTGGMGVILLLLAGAGVGLAAIKLTKKKPNRA